MRKRNQKMHKEIEMNNLKYKKTKQNKKQEFLPSQFNISYFPCTNASSQQKDILLCNGTSPKHEKYRYQKHLKV
jgi:hypothetical protein